MFGHLIAGALGHAIVTWAFSPIGLVILAVGVLVLGFMLLPTAMPKILFDVRTWLIAALALACAAYTHLEAHDKVLAAQLNNVAQAEQLQAGATAALNDRLANIKTTTVQVTNLRRIEQTAPAGQKEDAVLDQIGKDDAANKPATGAGSGAAHGSKLDSMLDAIGKHQP